MVYLENRKYLPLSSPFRQDKHKLSLKSKKLLSALSRTYAEIKDNHLACDKAKNKYENYIFVEILIEIPMVFCRCQAAHIAKTTGCKGSYPLQKLKFHDPMKQTVPDAMHTIKDAIEHFVYLIAKDDSTKVVAAEAELKRFGFITGD